MILDTKPKLKTINVKTNILLNQMGIYFLARGILYMVLRISRVKNQKSKAKIKGIRIPLPITNAVIITTITIMKFAGFFIDLY